MSYTLGEAAKHSGFSKPTLSRAIKKGALSAKRLDDGSYQIDPSELERWNDSNGHRNGSVTRILTSPETQETPAETDLLQAEVQSLRKEKIERLESLVASLERERDDWKEQAQRLALRAPVVAPQPAPTPEPARLSPQKATGGLFASVGRWMAGKGGTP